MTTTGTKFRDDDRGDIIFHMQKSQIHQAEILRLTHDGRGVAQCNGKTIFIDNALPGETILFKYRRHHGRFDEGFCVEVLNPSPHRTIPRCPFYGICGGCSLQHVDSSVQIHEKQKTLENQLQHIGKVSPLKWLEPLCGPSWGYRTKRV